MNTSTPTFGIWERGRHLLGQDAELGMFRAPHARGGEQDRLGVTPTSDHPAPTAVERLEHEYGLRDELDDKWALKPLELVREGGRTILLLADHGGRPLDELLNGAPLPVARFLPLAIKIAEALGALHRSALIHKDIRPFHIIVDEAEAEVRFTGFGLASRISRERSVPSPSELGSASLPYIAPEQTGRMNRSVDARSDLYSLGVTFYQMLTGSLPFVGAEPMEWVHAHIARQPTPPSERTAQVPTTLSNIVMKLLSKAAEDRYQTAEGLKADLERHLAQLRSANGGGDFALGLGDLPTDLRIPEKLYGREREIAALQAAFEGVAADGRSGLVLFSGYSGIGKSAIVNELRKVIVPHRGHLAAGKFDQYRRDIPYATISQAFRGLVLQILTRDDEVVAGYRTAILDAVGPDGQILTNLIPELELIIGKQPDCPALAFEQAEHRFQKVWRRFLGVFARPERPFVLFLDDLQWLDLATLKLLGHLATHPEVRHVLFIGAYRDNEVGPAHPLRSALDHIRKLGAVREVQLQPLSEHDVVHLLRDTLTCGAQAAAPLARLLHQKTSGNPFFVIQFLRTLWDEGLLQFDPGKGAWTWDLASIEAKGYTDNVVDLMIDRLRRLPEAAREILKSFSCFGNRADVATLALIEALEPEAVHAALADAVREGLVYRSRGAYHFLHDRIQEAAYALVPQARRPEAHLRIGRLLLSGLQAEQLHERAFELANQFNRGATLIAAPEERRQVAELNLIAGRRAKAATAYASALGFLTSGMALLSEDDWARNHDLAFALELNRAECEFLTGALQDALARLSELWRRATSRPEQAAITTQLALYTAVDQSDLALAACLRYLDGVGITWTPHPSDDEVAREYAAMWERIGARPIAALADLPEMRDPDRRATMDVLSGLIAPAALSDQNLQALVLGRLVNLSLEHGNCDASCYAYVLAAGVLGARFGNYPASFELAKLGVELVEREGFDRFKALVYVSFGYVFPWMHRWRDGLPITRLGSELARERGDLTSAAFGCFATIQLLANSGEPLDRLEDEIEDARGLLREARFTLMDHALRPQLALVRTLRGRTPRLSILDDGDFSEARSEQRFAEDHRLRYAECYYWLVKIQARVFARDYDAAVKAALKAESLLWAVPHEDANFHFYAALAHAGAYDSAAAAEQRRHAEALATHAARLAGWGVRCPANFEDRSVLVAGEMARIEGRDLDAQRLYEAAIDTARRNGFTQNEALASEIAAEFYLNRGLETSATAHLRNARACYMQWGALGKVRQLDRLDRRLSASDALAPAGSLSALDGQLDIATVLKASQAISRQIELERLVETLMTIAMQSSGAVRGLLILPRNGSYEVEAEGRAKQDVVEVVQAGQAGLDTRLPRSVLHYVTRSGEHVLLDDAARPHPYQDDPYFGAAGARSILCLPLVQQRRVTGVLYLENPLTAHAFTPDRIELLEVLAAQAVISLENARLYRDLQERGAKIRRLFESNIIGILQWGLTEAIGEANDAALELLGYTREDLRAGKMRWADIKRPESPACAQATAALHGAGSFAPYEEELTRKDGTRVPVLIGGALFAGSQDEGVAFVLDLTERKQAELRQKTLVDELNHRVKNTLATVQSISSQTLRTAVSSAAFHDELEGRLHALSQTHNVLNQSGWQGATLRGILDKVLAPHARHGEQRLQISGEDVIIGPTPAVTIGMAFHELATNALKYGALSAAEGRVRIEWKIRDRDRLQILWQEIGGPEVQPPRRKGFGLRLIERILPAQLQGSVRLEFLPDGVKCSMDASLEEIRKVHSPDPR